MHLYFISWLLSSRNAELVDLGALWVLAFVGPEPVPMAGRNLPDGTERAWAVSA